MTPRLNKTFLDKIKDPGRYTFPDQNGLALLVKVGGTKAWTQRLRVNGKRKEYGLGSYKDITPEEAKTKAAKNRQSVKDGKPLGYTKDMTFREAAEKTIALHESGWKSAKTKQNWQSVFEEYVHPHIGDVPVSTVTAGQIMEFLKPLWSKRRDHARKIRQRTSAVFEWAIAHEYRTENPAGAALLRAMPKMRSKRKTVVHHPTLPYAKTADVLDKVRACTAYPITKLALEFTVLTACRSGEVRGARWSEIDLENEVWTIPAARMKMGIDHQVPLSGRCIKILNEAQNLSTGSDLVFPSIRAKMLSDNTLSKLLRDNGFQGTQTVHGFRSSFRDWAAERSSAPREIAEYCLAHIVGEGAELAYRRTDYFEKRRALMQQWGEYLAQ